MSSAEPIESEQGLVSPRMLQVCAWCEQGSHSAGAAASGITHGVCTSCLHERLEQLNESGARQHAVEKNQAALCFRTERQAEEFEDSHDSC